MKGSAQWACERLHRGTGQAVRAAARSRRGRDAPTVRRAPMPACVLLSTACQLHEAYNTDLESTAVPAAGLLAKPTMRTPVNRHRGSQRIRVSVSAVWGWVLTNLNLNKPSPVLASAPAKGPPCGGRRGLGWMQRQMPRGFALTAALRRALGTCLQQTPGFSAHHGAERIWRWPCWVCVMTAGDCGAGGVHGCCAVWCYAT